MADNIQNLKQVSGKRKYNAKINKNFKTQKANIHRYFFAVDHARLAHIVGPPTARQRYAIEIAYRWRAVGGPLLCANWVSTDLLSEYFLAIVIMLLFEYQN